jgi:hypothetical protein
MRAQYTKVLTLLSALALTTCVAAKAEAEVDAGSAASRTTASSEATTDAGAGAPARAKSGAVVRPSGDTRLVEAPEVIEARAAYDKDRDGISLAFGAMGLFNLAKGAAMLTFERDPFWIAFALESVGFGGVNFGSAVGWLFMRPKMDKELKTVESVENMRQALRDGTWLGMAFEVGYIAAGALMWGLVKQPFLSGLGAGVVLQGGQTLALDIVEIFWLKSPKPRVHAPNTALQGRSP